MGNGVKKRRGSKQQSPQSIAKQHAIEEALKQALARAMDPTAKRNIVVVGGGIIGSTTAYFLSRHPKFNPSLHRITVLEATAVAAGASGKAGGLLALWAYPQCLVPLSYRLHAELAAEHDGAKRWGYRRVGCGSFEATVTREQVEAGRRATEGTKPAPGSVAAAAAKSETASETATALDGTATAVAAPAPGAPGNATNGDGIEALPATAQAAAAPGANAGEEEKGWERLPKQDQAAEDLLAESVLPADLDWVNRAAVESYDEMGMPGATETAQVHPFDFTTSMAQLAQDKEGVEVITRAQVTKINQNSTSVSGGVDSVEYLDRDSGETRTIEDVTDVVVTAGPWTGKLLPKSKVEGLRAHSVVYEADVSPYAVFTRVVLPEDYIPEHRKVKGQRRKHKRIVDPEIYARPFGEVYACGEPDRNNPLPETADLVQVDEANCDDLLAYISTFSPVLAASPVKAKQACYLPQREGGPLVGATSVPGLYVAAGHTCWGIQNGPATGKLMSEFVFDGRACSSDVAELDPRRYSRI